MVRSDDKFLLRVFSLPPDTRSYRDFPKAEMDVEISEPIVKLAREIWVMAMLDARYSPKKGLGMDGSTYTFSTYTSATRSMNGTTWSPDSEAPPKWMVEAGNAVLDFARSSKRDVSGLERKLVETKRKISTYIRERKKMNADAE